MLTVKRSLIIIHFPVLFVCLLLALFLSAEVTYAQIPGTPAKLKTDVQNLPFLPESDALANVTCPAATPNYLNVIQSTDVCEQIPGTQFGTTRFNWPQTSRATRYRLRIGDYKEVTEETTTYTHTPTTGEFETFRLTALSPYGHSQTYVGRIKAVGCGQNGTPGQNGVIEMTQTPLPDPTFTLRGNIFIDSNKNNIFDAGAGEPRYTQFPVNISIVNSLNQVVGTRSITSGTFEIPNLTQDVYRIRLGDTPNYFNSFPNGHAYTVHACSAGLYKDSPLTGITSTTSFCQVTPNSIAVQCIQNPITAKQINRLDFALTTQAGSWIQARGLNVRIENSMNGRYTNPVSRTTTCQQEFLTKGTDANAPGIFFSGKHTWKIGPDGMSKLSDTGWVVGKNASTTQDYGDVYSSSNRITRTSYSFVSGRVRQSGLTTVPLVSASGWPCATAFGCTLPSNLPSNIYVHDGDFYLDRFDMPDDMPPRNYVFLIKGNLFVRGKVDIRPGSTAFFVSASNIIIPNTVGDPTPSCPMNEEFAIDGFFSADKNFEIRGRNRDCADGADLMLKMAGTIVVNAARKGGYFLNYRSLCSRDSEYPVFLINERADFFLNLPDIVKVPGTIWQEISP
jgi:hypothetical protein